MLLAALVITGAVVLALMLLVLWRAVRYVRRHPELITTASPIGYVRCQRTLQQVIERSKALAGADLGQTTFTWEGLVGISYRLTRRGVDQRRGEGDWFTLRWDDIGGVGVQMQPEFSFVDYDRDRSVDVQKTVGYSFQLLVVPLMGSTWAIAIPTDGRAEAVEFAAQLLARAQRAQKRISVFGFDRPPAPARRRISRRQ